MKHFTMHVEATFSFALAAESEEAAKQKARELLMSHDPVSCGQFRAAFEDPFVAVAEVDINASLRAELDTFLTSEEERVAI